MKAAFIRDYGAPVEVGERPKPNVLPDSVLIEVHASSVNPVDSIIRSGYLKEVMPIEFPYVMGNDLSGVIVELGKEARNFKVGDEVFVRPNPKQAETLAEFCMVKEADLALKPRTISHREAATIPLVGLLVLARVLVLRLPPSRGVSRGVG